MKHEQIRLAIEPLAKCHFFLTPEIDEMSWQAGPVSDRIKMRLVDSIKIEEDLVVLRSRVGTWFGDKEVFFSISTGAVSLDKNIWYAQGPRIVKSER